MKKFNPEKLKKLNNPERLKMIPCDFIIKKAGLNNNIDEKLCLVDIGAGTGFFSINMSALFKVKPFVFACDISDIMLDWMTNNICKTHDNIRPVKMQESSVPLDNCIADLVFTINLHHELHEPAQILAEALRLLKPGGKIAIIDWKKNAKNKKTSPPDDIRFTGYQVKDQLVAAGFKNIEVNDEADDIFMVFGGKE